MTFQSQKKKLNKSIHLEPFYDLHTVQEKNCNYILVGENDRGSHLPDGATGGVEENETQELKTATNMELERARVLSAEAKRVLSDLNMGKNVLSAEVHEY